MRSVLFLFALGALANPLSKGYEAFLAKTQPHSLKKQQDGPMCGNSTSTWPAMPGSGLDECAAYNGHPACCTQQPPSTPSDSMFSCMFKLDNYFQPQQCTVGVAGFPKLCLCVPGTEIIDPSISDSDYLCVAKAEICPSSGSSSSAETASAAATESAAETASFASSSSGDDTEVLICSQQGPYMACMTGLASQFSLSFKTCDGFEFQTDPDDPLVPQCEASMNSFNHMFDCLNCAPVSQEGDLLAAPYCASSCEFIFTNCYPIFEKAGCSFGTQYCAFGPNMIPPGGGECFNDGSYVPNSPSAGQCFDLARFEMYKNPGFTDSVLTTVSSTICPSWDGQQGCCDTDADFNSWFAAFVDSPITWDIGMQFMEKNFLCWERISASSSQAMCSTPFSMDLQPCSCFGSDLVLTPGTADAFCILEKTICDEALFATKIPSSCWSDDVHLSCTETTTPGGPITYSCQCDSVGFSFEGCQGFTFSNDGLSTEGQACMESDPFIKQMNTIGCESVCRPATGTDYSAPDFEALCGDYCRQTAPQCRMGFVNALAPSCPKAQDAFQACRGTSVELGTYPNGRCFDGTTFVDTSPTYPVCIDIPQTMQQDGLFLAADPSTRTGLAMCPDFNGVSGCCTDADVQAALVGVTDAPTSDVLLYFKRHFQCNLAISEHHVSKQCQVGLGAAESCICLSSDFVTNLASGYFCGRKSSICDNTDALPLECTGNPTDSTLTCVEIDPASLGIDLDRCDGFEFDLSVISTQASECAASALEAYTYTVCPLVCSPVNDLAPVFAGTYFDDNHGQICNAYCQAEIFPCENILLSAAGCTKTAAQYCDAEGHTATSNCFNGSTGGGNTPTQASNPNQPTPKPTSKPDTNKPRVNAGISLFVSPFLVLALLLLVLV